MLEFGKHTAYVLSAYGVTLLGLAGLILYTFKRDSK